MMFVSIFTRITNIWFFNSKQTIWKTGNNVCSYTYKKKNTHNFREEDKFALLNRFRLETQRVNILTDRRNDDDTAKYTGLKPRTTDWRFSRQSVRVLNELFLKSYIIDRQICSGIREIILWTTDPWDFTWWKTRCLVVFRLPPTPSLPRDSYIIYIYI